LDAQSVLNGAAYSREEGVSIIGETSLPEGVVVSDVRFANEVEKIKELGGRLIKVTRKESDKKANTVGIIAHASEKDQQSFPSDLFDCILQNNGTFSDLNKAVDIAAKTFNGIGK
jgi:hypothetical protein